MITLYLLSKLLERMIEVWGVIAKVMYYFIVWYFKILFYILLTAIKLIIAVFDCIGRSLEYLLSLLIGDKATITAKIIKWTMWAIILAIIVYTGGNVDYEQSTVESYSRFRVWCRIFMLCYMTFVPLCALRHLGVIGGIKFPLSAEDKKSKGLQWEHQVAKKLSRMGYHSVKVTKGSGDFGADIIASKGWTKYAIQCKYYTGTVGVAAVQEAIAGKAYYKCDKAMVITNSTYTPAARELARKSGVKLVERFDADTFIDEMEEMDAILED